MKITLLTIFILLISFSLAAETEHYFRFRFTSADELSNLTKFISIDDVKDGYVYAYATETGLQSFSRLGYSCEFLTHPGLLYQPAMTNEKETGRTWQYYPTYDAFVNVMYQFQTDYPDLCEVHSLGYTVNGREILIAKISDNVTINEPEPEFLYISSMHGDETTGYIMLLNLIQHLLQNYGILTQITNLVDNLQIWISPLQNPDGTYYSGNHTVFGARRFNANGVDLNRNFPDALLGPHPDGNDWQPETIIMMDFADERQIVMGANYHGGTEVVNYPWDTWPRLHADDDWYIYTSQIYANSAQANSPTGYMSGYNNGITNGYQWYCVHGSRQDYMNYFQSARETTIEISDTKLLPENQLEDHWNYNREAMLLYLEQALYGIQGIVSDQYGMPVSAKIEMIDHDFDNSEVYSSSLSGYYHRLLAAGSYDMQVSAYGYYDQVFENLSVSENSLLNIDVVMQEAAQFNLSGSVKNGSNDQPIPDAALEILNTPLAVIYTDENGQYQINDVYEGIYQVYISAEDYSNILVEIIVAENSTVHDFYLFESQIEDFETGDFESFTWYFGGNADWTIDSNVVYEGDFAAASGSITHNQQSSLVIDLFVTAAGEISFYYKVSSEYNYDFLKFYDNDDLIESWSGNIDWQIFQYNVDVGFHQFKWSYEKDGSVNSGADRSWLDLVSFPCTEQMHAGNLLTADKLILYGNHPNPFNPITFISFSLNRQTPVLLEIYNLRGQKINTLVDNNLPAGRHSIAWNGSDSDRKQVASGVYFYRLTSEDHRFTKKMLLIK